MLGQPAWLPPSGPVSVPENSKAGTKVINGDLEATDVDIKDVSALRYSITGGTGQSKFDIGSTDGLLSVTADNTLDHEQDDEYGAPSCRLRCAPSTSVYSRALRRQVHASGHCDRR